VPEAIQRRQIAHFTKADPAYGRGVGSGSASRRSFRPLNERTPVAGFVPATHDFWRQFRRGWPERVRPRGL